MTTLDDNAENNTAQRALSKRDTRRVLALLANPPAANARLVRAAKAGFVLPRAKSADAISGERSRDFRT